MFDFIRRSLRLKLIVLVLGITFAALLLTCSILILYDLETQRESWINDLVTQADLIGTASAPSLSFEDSTSAHQNLALLRVRPQIEAAALYTLGGRTFASYRREGSSVVVPHAIPEDGARRSGNWLQIVRPVSDADERVGTIWLMSRFDLAGRLWSYVGILAAVTIVALGLAAVLSTRLESAVTRPVLAIAEAAQVVRDRHDFSIRVPRSTKDETGILVDSFNELLERVGRRTAELEAEMAERLRAQAALLEANRRKDEFLATLGHELRNPLAPIRNAIHYLTLRENDDPEVAKTLAMAERQVKHMVRLIEDLLDISRITRDTLELRPEPFELGEFVSEVAESSVNTAVEEMHDLTFDAPVERVEMFADRARLLQATGNVIHNAIKYTPPGGKIRVVVTRMDDRLSIVVRDTGIGIPKEHLQDVFQPFVQLDRSLEKSRGGLGIGLALTRRIVSLHGGTITAESEGPGMGSTFRIELPIVQPPKGPAEAAAPAAPASAASVAGAASVAAAASVAGAAGVAGAGAARAASAEITSTPAIRVLVADDNVDAAESLALLVERLGATVTMANDGREALECARRLRPQLALVDIGMPGLNGYDVARAIRDEDWGHDVRLVALTGWGQVEDKTQATDAGFDTHLTKPVEMATLRALVNSVAQGSAATRPS
jgi:signal transduction histidine kinase/ActR/RegA family two-component response regulator